MFLKNLYSCLTYALAPFILGRFLLKGIKNIQYLDRLGERFGFINLPNDFTCDIWFHAVSVGEVKTINRLIKQLKKELPYCSILLTTTTPTGYEIVKKELEGYVYHTYFPLDLGIVVNRFLDKVSPSLVLIVETEIWPNLFYTCAKRKIPLILINARLSPVSFKGYKKISSFIKEILNGCEKILARSYEDAKKFFELGVDKNRIVVSGNLKFDIEVSSDVMEKGKKLREELFKNKGFIWTAASTHKGEEEIILKVHKEILKDYPNSLLILAPRHPERTPEVIKLCDRFGLKYKRRTSFTKKEGFDVFIVDTLGELLLFYSLCDVCFVGGSLVEVGGHNLLEPAVLGIPIISGKHLFNFEEVKELLLKKEALLIVNSKEELKNELVSLIGNHNKRRYLGERAKKVVMENQGSSKKVLSIIKEYVADKKIDI